MVQATVQDTLAGALGLASRESLALVGGGGKTSALQRLARELAAAGGKVVVTTTTAMFLSELVVAGPVVVDTVDDALVAGLVAGLAKDGVAGAAHSHGHGGKVVGLLPATVDRLWAENVADYLIVEADGSRGKPLKAFGPHEPQVPPATTVIVQVAGLDAIGKRLADEHVHRAGLLATALGIAPDAEVSVRVFADCLRVQLRRLRQGWQDARIVTLLNKADGPDGDAPGLDVAGELLAVASGRRRAGGQGGGECPDGIVVASLLEGRFAVVSATEE